MAGSERAHKAAGRGGQGWWERKAMLGNDVGWGWECSRRRGGGVCLGTRIRMGIG